MALLRRSLRGWRILLFRWTHLGLCPTQQGEVLRRRRSRLLRRGPRPAGRLVRAELARRLPALAQRIRVLAAASLTHRRVKTLLASCNGQRGL